MRRLGPGLARLKARSQHGANSMCPTLGCVAHQARPIRQGSSEARQGKAGRCPAGTARLGMTGPRHTTGRSGHSGVLSRLMLDTTVKDQVRLDRAWQTGRQAGAGSVPRAIRAGPSRVHPPPVPPRRCPAPCRQAVPPLRARDDRASASWPGRPPCAGHGGIR